MSHHDDFEPGLPVAERAELEDLAAWLVARRAVPAPAFRGDLRRRLVAERAGRRTARLEAIACLATGFALLLIATLGVNDVGPLAPTPLATPDLASTLLSSLWRG